MPDEPLIDESPETGDSEAPDPTDPEKLIRALRRERETRKRLERELRTSREDVAYAEYRGRYPWLKREWLEGKKPEDWVHLIEDWATVFQSADTSTTDTAESASTVEAPATATEQTMKVAASLPSSRADSADPALDASEWITALQQGKLSGRDILEGVQAGRLATHRRIDR